MSSIADRLTALGYTLSAFPARPGPLRMVVVHGGLAWVSGQPPARDGEIACHGTVGVDVTVEEARAAAALCAVTALGALDAELDDIDDIERIVKLTGFVRCREGFTAQSKIIDGASELLESVIGTGCGHARSAIGVSSLPGGMAVEVELVVALRTAERTTESC